MRLARLWQCVVLSWGLAWLLGGCTFVPLYPRTLLPAECPLPVPEELEEGRTIRCGYLQVPQDRTAPAGRQVKIPYAHIRAESAHPYPDPVVYIVGGPGGSALAEFTEIYGWFRTLRRDRDLILYDQRGTLLAEPTLDCALQGLPPSVDEIAAVSARVPVEFHPLDANDVVVARCAERLQAQGVDLAHYDTATHARDVLDLVAALGYEQFNLYGASYGARVALEVMRHAPPGLRAVALDSVYPPTVNAYEVQQAVAAYEALAKSFVLCAGDAVCDQAYPDLTARFARAVDERNRRPLALPLSWQPRFTGDDLLQLLLTRLNGALLPYVPRLVDEVARGESTLLVALLRGEVPPPSLPRALPPSSADEARVTDFVLALNGALLVEQAQLDDAAQQEWQQLMARNPDRDRLARFIEDYLPVTLSQTLLAQLAQLTDADLMLVFAELRSIPLYPLTRGAYLAVECRDEQPFNDYQTAVNAHHGLGIPNALVADEITRLRHIWAQCALFPTGVAPLAQNAPVISSIPTLVLQGSMDTVTPPSWALAARRTLTNNFYFEFPTLGHLVIQQPLSVTSGCPMQIVRAFLNAPERMPDGSCVDVVYAIEWSLDE